MGLAACASGIAPVDAREAMPHAMEAVFRRLPPPSLPPTATFYPPLLPSTHPVRTWTLTWQIMYLLRQTYYLCKERDALRHFSSLCHLSQMQGLPIGSAYRNAHAARDFAMAISTAVAQQWLTHARSSRALGLMIDESTTVSSEGTLILYLRFLMHGRATTKFWKLVQVADGSADTITKVPRPAPPVPHASPGCWICHFDSMPPLTESFCSTSPSDPGDRERV